MMWTAEHDAILREHHGKISATLIADMMGCGLTRSAILGRAFRIKLPKLREAVKRKPYVRKWRARAKKTAPIIVKPVELNIPFLDRIMGRQCSFPTSGEGRSLLVCGNAVAEGNPYCGWHCSIAYGPARTKPQNNYYWNTGHRRAA